MNVDIADAPIPDGQILGLIWSKCRCLFPILQPDLHGHRRRDLSIEKLRMILDYDLQNLKQRGPEGSDKIEFFGSRNLLIVVA